jgi:capsular polysaccharide biosynthesis protein
LKQIKYVIYNISSLRFIFKSKVLLVTDEWSNGPYHFWVDVLSRIIAYETAGGNLTDYTLVLPETAYMRESAVPILERLEIRFREVVFMNLSDLHLVFGEINFVTLPHRMGSNNTSIIEKIQNRVLGNSGFYEEKPELKVYYFRKNRRRVVVNDDDVQQFLSDKGFICTDFDDMSYLDAWRLMAKTKVLMGIHGGGMTNMFFMPRGGTIVEFRTDNPNPQSHCYWHLAWSLGHTYTLVIGKSTTPGNNTIEGSGGCDIKVDIDTLSEWFEQNNL